MSHIFKGGSSTSDIRSIVEIHKIRIEIENYKKMGNTDSQLRFLESVDTLCTKDIAYEDE